MSCLRSRAVVEPLRQRVAALFASEDGQTMGEYGVVLSVITIGLVTVFGVLSGDIVALIDKIRAALVG